MLPLSATESSISSTTQVSRKFYQNVIGAKLLNRPKFPTNGFWLWLGNVQLHLIQSDLVVPPDHPDGGTKVNHFSFDVYDFEDCEKRIKAAGIEYKKVYVPEGDRGINQIFFQDPGTSVLYALPCTLLLFLASLPCFCASLPLSVVSARADLCLHVYVTLTGNFPVCADLHWIELCDCHKMADFIFGDFDEARAVEISKFYSEGVDLQMPFIATCVVLLMGSRYTQSSKDSSPTPLFELFKTYAGDDEMIEQSELARMLARMGFAPSDSSLKSLHSSIDVDNNASISYDEFVCFVRKVCLNTPNEQLAAEIFKAIDTNASGSVTTAEFRKVLKGLGVVLTDAQAAETFGLVDADGSGSIHPSECSSLMEQFRQQLML
jgi:Ca2+-binding EF-hand superfamily protein